MANFVFNIAKGRGVEWANQINANSPVNQIFVLRGIASTGVESDATLIDKDDFSAVVSGATDFSTNTGLAIATQKTFDTGTITVTVDDGNDRVDLDVADQTWTAVANDGTGAISDLIFGVDLDSAAGTDANIIPLSFHDFSVTPDGSDITAQIAVFIRVT